MTLALLGVGGGGGFVPTDLTGLLLWLDTTQGMYQEISSPVTPSGNTDPIGSWVARFGPTFSALSNARRPTRQTVSDKIRVRYDGSDDFLCTDNASFVANFAGTDKPFSVGCNFQFLGLGATTALWGHCSTASVNPFTYIANSTTPNYQRQRRNDANQQNSSNDGTPNLSEHSSIITYDGTSMLHYVDGVAVGAALAISSGAVTFTRFAIGALARNTPSLFLNGYQGHIIILDHAASAPEITQMNTFLLAN